MSTTVVQDPQTINLAADTGLNDYTETIRALDIVSRGPKADIRAWEGLVVNGDWRPAIQAAIDAVYAKGGGTVYIPPGTYELKSDSIDPDTHQGLLTLKNNVNIMGDGDTSILKVAGGTNARWEGTTGPNVMSTKLTLSNCVFKDFVVDWNGANNLLTSSSHKRNNASIMTLRGGYNITIDNVTIKNTPGNQCIFLNADKDLGQGNITVQNCWFVNNGDGLPGNYNLDHTSIYIDGDHCKVKDCYFIADESVVGAAFEVHGSFFEVSGCYAKNYEHVCWIWPKLKKLTDVYIHDNTFENVELGCQFTGTAYGFGKIDIHNNNFYGLDGLRNTIIFQNAPTKLCDEIRITDNTFRVTNNKRDTRPIQVNLTKSVYIKGNKIEGFGGTNITFGSGNLGDGYQAYELEITGNDFIEAGYETIATTLIAPMNGTLKVRKVRIGLNVFHRSASTTTIIPISVASPVDDGLIYDNIISSNYANDIYTWKTAKDIVIRHNSRNKAPVNVYCAMGSMWYNNSTNTLFTKNNNNVIGWQKTTKGTAAPTTGTYAIGDIHENTSITVGGIDHWRCSAAGTPGIWQPSGIIGAVQVAASANITTPNANTQTAAYVQADVQSIVTLANALKADMAALKAKLRTAKIMAT